MGRLCDSVLLHGPLWAGCPFLFEDVNYRLLLLFHGTQAVSFQMMKHFLGTKKINDFANACIPQADKQVQEVYYRLSTNVLPIKKAHTFEDGGLSLGVSNSVQLSISGCIALDKCANKKTGICYVPSFQWFVSGVCLFTTFAHSDKMKRNNSFVDFVETFFWLTNV